jgi:hypothetical protein
MNSLMCKHFDDAMVASVCPARDAVSHVLCEFTAGAIVVVSNIYHTTLIATFRNCIFEHS